MKWPEFHRDGWQNELHGAPHGARKLLGGLHMRNPGLSEGSRLEGRTENKIASAGEPEQIQAKVNGAAALRRAAHRVSQYRPPFHHARRPLRPPENAQRQTYGICCHHDQRFVRDDAGLTCFGVPPLRLPISSLLTLLPTVRPSRSQANLPRAAFGRASRLHYSKYLSEARSHSTTKARPAASGRTPLRPS